MFRVRMQVASKGRVVDTMFAHGDIRSLLPIGLCLKRRFWRDYQVPNRLIQFWSKPPKETKLLSDRTWRF